MSVYSMCVCVCVCVNELEWLMCTILCVRSINKPFMSCGLLQHVINSQMHERHRLRTFKNTV